VAFGFKRKERKQTGKPGKMADADKVALWKSKIATALNLRDTANESEWRQFNDLYNCQNPILTNDNIDDFHLNDFHLSVRRTKARINYRNPRWTVLTVGGNASTDQEIDNADLVRSWLQWFVYSNDIREDVLDPTTLDALIVGTGIVQVGFNSIPEKQEKFTDENKAAIELEEMAKAISEGVDPDEAATRAEEASKEMPDIPPSDGMDDHKENQPYVQHIDAFNFVMSPGYPDLKSAWNNGGWVAKRIVAPIDVIKAEPRYKKSARDELEATRDLTSPGFEFIKDEGIYDEDGNMMFDFVAVWEIWTAPDKKNNKPGRVMVVAEESQKFLYNEENPFDLDSFPFVDFRFIKQKNQFWGIPFGRSSMDTNEAKDQMVSYWVDFARSQKTVLLAQENVWQDNHVNNLAELSNNSVLRVPDVTEQTARFMSPNPMSPEIPNVLGLLGQHFQQHMSVGPQQNAGYGPSGSSATEAQLVNQNAQVNTDDFISVITDGWARIGRMLVKLLKEMGDESQIIKVSKVDGAVWQGEFTIDEINEEFDIRIAAGSTQPIDEAVRQKQLIDLTGMLFNLAPEQIEKEPILTDLLENYQDRLPNTKNYISQNPLNSQEIETLMMIETGEVVPIRPTDPHMKHVRQIENVVTGYQMAVQNQMLSEEEATQRIAPLQQHAQMHMQAIEQRNAGAQAQQQTSNGGAMDPGGMQQEVQGGA